MATSLKQLHKIHEPYLTAMVEKSLVVSIKDLKHQTFIFSKPKIQQFQSFARLKQVEVVQTLPKIWISIEKLLEI